MAYDTIPGIDGQTLRFPPGVQQAIEEQAIGSTRLTGKFAHLVNGQLVIGSVPVSMGGDPAALNVPGWVQGVFIPKGGTIPNGVPADSLVLELEV